MAYLQMNCRIGDTTIYLPAEPLPPVANAFV
jgi:hypothetical protein